MRAASFPSLLSQLIEGESSDDEAFSASPFNSPFAISVAVTDDVVVSNWYLDNVSCSNSFVCPPIVVVVIQSPPL
jgi:hypothetical protein